MGRGEGRLLGERDGFYKIKGAEQVVHFLGRLEGGEHARTQSKKKKKKGPAGVGFYVPEPISPLDITNPRQLGIWGGWGVLVGGAGEASRFQTNGNGDKVGRNRWTARWLAGNGCCSRLRYISPRS